jgi:hypothetical protein
MRPAAQLAAHDDATRAQKLSPSPQPLPRRRRDLLRWYGDIVDAVRRYIGAIPDVPIWHHLWLDSRLLLDWARSQSTTSSRLLLCDEISPLGATLPKHLPIDVLRFSVRPGSGAPPLAKLLRPEIAGSSAPADAYDHILIHICRAEVLALRPVLELAQRHARPPSTISVFIEHRNAELDSSNFSFELSQHVDSILPSGWIGYRLETRFAGGTWKRRLRLLERKLYPQLRPPSLRRLPNLIVGGSLWVVVAALTALNNLIARKASSFCPDYCTSVLLSLSKGRP